MSLALASRFLTAEAPGKAKDKKLGPCFKRLGFLFVSAHLGILRGHWEECVGLSDKEPLTMCKRE